MPNRTNKPINLQTIRRLPMYLHYLKKASDQGAEFVSSATIARDMELESIVVRKDLAIKENLGKPRIGYRVEDLIEMIEDFLGWNNTSAAVIVGVGNLGSALLGYEGFKTYGLNIAAAFDNNPKTIGTQIHGHIVQSLDKLPEIAREKNVNLGIVCVPPVAAQEVADLMTSSGIRGIWNYTPATIQVPEGCITEREDLAAGLAMLSYKLPRIKENK